MSDTTKKGKIDLIRLHRDKLHVECSGLIAALAAKDARIAEMGAQNEWLKNRLEYLQRPASSSKSREEWLLECGMPPLSATTGGTAREA